MIAYLAGALRASLKVDWRLYELTVETAMLRRHGPTGALPLAAAPRTAPITRTWRDPAARLTRPLVASLS